MLKPAERQGRCFSLPRQQCLSRLDREVLPRCIPSQKTACNLNGASWKTESPTEQGPSFACQWKEWHSLYLVVPPAPLLTSATPFTPPRRRNGSVCFYCIFLVAHLFKGLKRNTNTHTQANKHTHTNKQTNKQTSKQASKQNHTPLFPSAWIRTNPTPAVACSRPQGCARSTLPRPRSVTSAQTGQNMSLTSQRLLALSMEDPTPPLDTSGWGVSKPGCLRALNTSGASGLSGLAKTSLKNVTCHRNGVPKKSFKSRKSGFEGKMCLS